jgi:hypothetical protein
MTMETPTVNTTEEEIPETPVEKKKTKAKKAVTTEEGAETVPVKEKKVRKKKIVGTSVPKKERKPNAWLAHVKAYREKHPDTPYKQVLKDAKASYAETKAKANKV